MVENELKLCPHENTRYVFVGKLCRECKQMQIEGLPTWAVANTRVADPRGDEPLLETWMALSKGASYDNYIALHRLNKQSDGLLREVVAYLVQVVPVLEKEAYYLTAGIGKDIIARARALGVEVKS